MAEFDPIGILNQFQGAQRRKEQDRLQAGQLQRQGRLDERQQRLDVQDRRDRSDTLRSKAFESGLELIRSGSSVKSIVGLREFQSLDPADIEFFREEEKKFKQQQQSSELPGLAQQGAGARTSRQRKEFCLVVEGFAGDPVSLN